MKDFKMFDLIIFDFHKTLTDTVYFDQLSASTRNFISDLIFRPPNNELWDKKWMSGEINYTDVLRHLSSETAIPYEDLEESLFASLANICWNQPIWDFSQAIRKTTKTAIATINTDLFSKVIVPKYNLSEKFDAIVNSYELKNHNKTDICIAAADRLGLNLQEDQILLIDDIKKNIDEIVDAGGEGYQYQSAELFEKWLDESSLAIASQ